jgi:hypothetical protein
MFNFRNYVSAVSGSESSALLIGGCSTCDTHNVSQCRTEVVIPRSGCCPHLVVLQ